MTRSPRGKGEGGGRVEVGAGRGGGGLGAILRYVLSLFRRCCRATTPLRGLVWPLAGLLLTNRVSSSLEKSDSEIITLLFWIFPGKEKRKLSTVYHHCNYHNQHHLF